MNAYRSLSLLSSWYGRETSLKRSERPRWNSAAQIIIWPRFYEHWTVNSVIFVHLRHDYFVWRTVSALTSAVMTIEAATVLWPCGGLCLEEVRHTDIECLVQFIRIWHRALERSQLSIISSYYTRSYFVIESSICLDGCVKTVHIKLSLLGQQCHDSQLTL